MKLGISNIAWLPEELTEVLPLMEDMSATGLEVAPGLAFPGEADPFKPTAGAIRLFRDQLAAHNVELISMQALLFGVENAQLFGTPSERENFVRGIKRAIGLADVLGVGNLVMGSPNARAIPDEMDREAAVAEAIEIFRRLGDAAAASGAKIAMEPNPAEYGTNFLNTLNEVTAFTALVDHPAITINLDLGALQMNGEIRDFLDRTHVKASCISHAHISEPRLAPAPEDATLLTEISAKLMRQGYQGWFSIEMRRVESLRMQTIASSLAAAAGALAQAKASVA